MSIQLYGYSYTDDVRNEKCIAIYQGIYTPDTRENRRMYPIVRQLGYLNVTLGYFLNYRNYFRKVETIEENTLVLKGGEVLRCIDDILTDLAYQKDCIEKIKTVCSKKTKDKHTSLYTPL